MPKKREAVVKNLEAVKAANPDLADVVDKKIEFAQNMFNVDNLEVGKVEDALQSLEKIFDEVEEQLRKSRTGQGLIT